MKNRKTMRLDRPSDGQPGLPLRSTYGMAVRNRARRAPRFLLSGCAGDWRAPGEGSSEVLRPEAQGVGESAGLRVFWVVVEGLAQAGESGFAVSPGQVD